MNTIKVIKILPCENEPCGFKAELDENFEGTWENMRKVIGGYVRPVEIISGPIPDPFAVFCDEDAIPKGLRVSCLYGGQTFYGPVVIVGTDDYDTIQSVPDSVAKYILKQ